MKDWEKWLGLESLNDPELVKMITVVAEFCRDTKAGQQPCWLSLLGKFGVGKTHCAQKVFDWLSKRHDWKSSEFIHRKIYWPEFVNNLRSGNGYEELHDMLRWPVLFLDDIGAERDKSGFAAEQLNLILGVRVHRWTILTSNLNLAQIAAIEPRIADRIIREKGNRYIEVDTVSYGIRKAQQ